jgi:hypothetical protein
MANAAMRLVHETVDTGRPLVRSVDLVVEERGLMNYQCAACSTVLVRDAGPHLPDIIVICPACLALNEPDHLVRTDGLVAGSVSER